MKKEHIDRQARYRSAVEEYLQQCFLDDVPQKTLLEAMRYSLLAGGKRIRPILTLEFARVCGGRWEDALAFAAAIEMVHTYSLIHDDLPCMDNDDYRRGRLTNHKVYGEATATLAGDALLTAAFDCIAHAKADPAVAIKVAGILARNAGELGMVGGQVLDMQGETRKLNAQEVFEVHSRKTGCLISAACRMGVAAAGGSDGEDQAAAAYADALGLAFQIRDDLLDVLGDAKKLGKSTHMDEKKSTFVTLYGVDRCEQIISEQTELAIAALSRWEDTAFLQQLALDMAVRDH